MGRDYICIKLYISYIFFHSHHIFFLFLFGFVWFHKILGKKNVEENNFFIFGFFIKKYERKLNTIKIIKRFVYF